MVEGDVINASGVDKKERGVAFVPAVVAGVINQVKLLLANLH